MKSSQANRRCLAAVAILVLALPLTAADKVWIIQTNSAAGIPVHIIDAATNKVLAEVDGMERNHGAQVSPDGSWIYVSNEADSTVDIVSTKTMKVNHKILLSRHPYNLAITPDGRKVLRGDRTGARSVGCDRHSLADEIQNHLRARRRAQRVCDAGWQTRDRRNDRRAEHYRGRYRD